MNGVRMGGGSGHWHEVATAGRRLLTEPNRALLSKLLMNGIELLTLGAMLLDAAKLIEPGTTGIHWSAGNAAMMLILCATGAISLEQPTYQGWWQRGRGKQHPRAEQPCPIH